MKTLRFSLGARFDCLKDTVEPEDVDRILNEVTSVLTASEVESLHAYGGRFDFDGREEPGVYMFVLINGSIKRMKNVYHKLDSDARIHAMLEPRTPYLQNNVLRNAEGLEFFGVINKDGVAEGGSGRKLVFPKTASPRRQFTGGTVLVAPNSFKGTIPGNTAAKHIMRAIRERLPEITCVPVPAADGGDGTLDAVESAVLGARHSMEVEGPYGRNTHAEYYVVDGSKAMIESALASGLALTEPDERDVLKASSYGTGQLIMRAAHEGVGNIFVCLGGSATNDCGLGLARAVGVRFSDAEGNEVTEAGDMERIASMDVSGLDKQVREAKLTAVCDVTNPLTGEKGATYTFGLQKGADAEQLERLEKGMRNMEKLLNEHAGCEVCSRPGAGAAGGMGAMLMALFGAETMPGADAVLDIAEFDRKLKNASLVITGEGRIDKTSLDGKVVGAILSRTNRAGVPAALIAGSRGEGAEPVEALANFCEYTGGEDNALARFDEAAKRLAEKTEILFR
ncbi:MAG: glycerate kinase [Clostridia bacterium]|nr:glycerate kinase [Clostridia bacterium]